MVFDGFPMVFHRFSMVSHQPRALVQQPAIICHRQPRLHDGPALAARVALRSGRPPGPSCGCGPPAPGIGCPNDPPPQIGGAAAWGVRGEARHWGYPQVVVGVYDYGEYILDD